MLAGNVPGLRTGTYIASGSLLAGLVVDDAGEPLVSSHACKPVPGSVERGKVRYRYYVSRSAQDGVGGGSSMRIPAREIETAVVEAIAAAFDDPIALIEQARSTPTSCDLSRILDAAVAVDIRIRKRDRATVRAIVAQVEMHPAALQLQLHPAGLIDQLSVGLRPSPKIRSP